MSPLIFTKINLAKNTFCCFLAIPLLTLAAACNMNTPQSPLNHHISISSISDSNLTSLQKSDALAAESEELLNANGFEEANKVAILALNENPKQVKAGLIKVMTDLLLTLKGIGTRVKPLFIHENILIEDYTKGIDDLLKLYAQTPYFEKLLLDAKPNMASESEVASFLDQVSDKMEAISQFAKENKNSEITIKAYPLFAKELNHRYVHACELTLTKSYEYDIQCPDDSARSEVSFNRADFEELQMTANMVILYIAYLNSYDLTGVLDLTYQANKEHRDPFLNLNKFLEDAFKNSQFGKLRSQSRLKKVSAMGLDILAALQWAGANPKLSCPNGYGSGAKNRPGRLFNEGLCFSLGPQGSSYLAEQVNFLQGVPRELKVQKEDGSEYKTKTNYMAVFMNPIQDLRDLGQIVFDNCGNLVSTSDPSLAQLYPNQDANVVMPLINSKCNK